MKLFFWILIGVILYTYLGYAVLLLVLNGLKTLLVRNKSENSAKNIFPPVTLLIAAYNETEIVDEKMANILSIDYPKELLNILWVTDGSNDGTPGKLKKYPLVKVLHQTERRGKTAALNRAMRNVETPYVVFCDANTMMAPDSIKIIIRYFDDKLVGCVAGAKRIVRKQADDAAGVGEGSYWNYEAFIKKQESKFYSTLGAAGELYAIRTALFEEIEDNMIIDDFVISMKIAVKGYKIKYADKAVAIEGPSLNIKEELIRKIRIASGGFQTLVYMPQLLNFFKNGILTLEFFSHKVLRWTIVPWSLLLILPLNFLICIKDSWDSFSYTILLIVQLVFYVFVITGALFEKKTSRLRFLFLPFYIVMMNYAQIAGLIRFFRKKHTVVWEKARRQGTQVDG